MYTKDFKNRNSLTKKKAKSYNFSLNKIDEDVFEYVQTFLFTSGKEATVKLILQLMEKGKSEEEAKQIIKQYIYLDVLRHFQNADKNNIYIKDIAEKVLKDFSVDEFLEKRWRYVPFILKKHDFLTLLSDSKFPILQKYYDYNSPLYLFKNTYVDELKAKESKDIIFNDTKFYLSKSQRNIYSKVVDLRYQPASMKIVKARKKVLTNDDKIYLDNVAYQRSLSICMYCILDGDPNKAMPYFRYDSATHDHNNLYIGNDKRQDVFGAIAQNPHFHFQNEDDNLLCVKKFIGKDRRTKYKTGRCNAIDIPHLKRYLINLDNKSYEELKRDFDNGLDYGMPFLEYKVFNKSMTLNFNDILEKYRNGLNKENLEMFDKLINRFNSLKQNVPNSSKKYTFFAQFIKILDFLQFIHDEIYNSNNSQDLDYKEILSNLEVLLANNLVDGICKNTSNENQKLKKTTFEIDSHRLTKNNEKFGDENENK